jgi:hypothetical protein
VFGETQWVHFFLIEKHENEIGAPLKEFPACYMLSTPLNAWWIHLVCGYLTFSLFIWFSSWTPTNWAIFKWDPIICVAAKWAPLFWFTNQWRIISDFAHFILVNLEITTFSRFFLWRGFLPPVLWSGRVHLLLVGICDIGLSRSIKGTHRKWMSG